jgi:hypothetical protein
MYFGMRGEKEVVFGFELRALHLLGSCSTTWAMPQPYPGFVLFCFFREEQEEKQWSSVHPQTSVSLHSVDDVAVALQVAERGTKLWCCPYNFYFNLHTYWPSSDWKLKRRKIESFFSDLGIEAKASDMLGKHSSTDLLPQPMKNVVFFFK